MYNKTASFIQADGFRLKVIEQGQGPTLLIIGSADYYYRIMPNDIYQHFYCVFIDHRGFAHCERPVHLHDVSLEQISKDVERACSQLDIEPCWVMGHSGHAYMALDFAYRFPTRVKGCALIGAAPSLSEEMRTLQMANWQRHACQDRKTAFEKSIALLAGDIQLEPDRKFAHLCRRLGPMRWFNPNFDELPLWQDIPMHTALLDKLWGNDFAHLDISTYTQSIVVPVLALGGLQDFSIAPLSAWSDIHLPFPNINLVSLPECGHTPMLEQPDDFISILRDFVNH
ncbi:2-succinyl-6-hydroxy-2,4-cyclohexadiene-1-carboxylate synthase [Vibrio neptunius]|uniref:alpha/beta fold hydrolase n=1 Tax=Vibrio neptunius TaxID=170651 RepID=UPI0005F9FB85|nr:alpha/beta hydrolase [Vibrio neptunius]KJY93853.1 2-succinyl-6-hydroxy-2,4-cyclohexadiene-1-carboxylate synthase [Vibrio neptunius]